MQQCNINSRNNLFGQLWTNQYKRPTAMKAAFHKAVFFIPWGRRKAAEGTHQWGPIPVGLWAAPCCPHKQCLEWGLRAPPAARPHGQALLLLSWLSNWMTGEQSARKGLPIAQPLSKHFFKKRHFTNAIFIFYMKATACSNSGAYDICFTDETWTQYFDLVVWLPASGDDYSTYAIYSLQ